MNEIDRAFVVGQVKIHHSLMASAMQAASEFVENRAKLKADQLEADYQNRLFEAMRAPCQSQGTDK